MTYIGESSLMKTETKKNDVTTKSVVKELNSFLEGNYMAIHAYENYIHHIEDEKIKKQLQEIQQNHKQHAAMIAERIQNLGGVPVDDAGWMGSMTELFQSIKGATKDPVHILKDAIAGEQRGIKKSQQLLDGDLDPESLALVKKILAADEKHIETLKQLLPQEELL